MDGDPVSLPEPDRRTGLSRRVWLSTLAASLGVGVGIGFIRRGVRRSTADDSVTLPAPNASPAEPGIPTNPDLAGVRLPDLEVKDLDGNARRLSDFVGRPLVLNFWFAACRPCRLEMPDFATVHGELGDTVRFVGINHQDSAERARDFATQVGVTYELLRDPGGTVSSALRLGRFPTTVFVTPDGLVTSIQSGELNAAALRDRIQKELLS